MSIRFEDYPEVIKAHSLEIIGFDLEIETKKEEVDRLGIEIDREIVADENLTNDKKRKVRREELAECFGLKALELELEQMKRDNKIRRLELERIKSCFDVEKLNKIEKLGSLASYL